MAITLKNAKDIEGLRAANKIVAAALDYAEEFLKPGMTLLEVDKKIDEFITSKGAYPAFKGLYGFPNAACLSLNEVIIHGIPDNTILKEGECILVISIILSNFFKFLAASSIESSPPSLISTNPYFPFLR